MGQIIKSPVSVCLSVCPSVCHHSYGRNSHSILMKLYTIDRNPKSKNPFVGGQNPTIPSPIFPLFFTPLMHCQWQGLSTTVSNHVDRLWHLIAQRTLLGGRYTGDILAIVSNVITPCLPPKQNGIQALRQASVVVAIGNHNDVAVTSCR